MSYHNVAGNGRRDGLKKGKIGQSAAKHLWRKPGEGSTTIPLAFTLKRKRNRSRAQAIGVGENPLNRKGRLFAQILLLK